MAMPEAAIYKNNSLVFWKDQIRFARQFSVMQSEPKAHRVQTAPNDHFRLGILRLDAGHHPAADFAVYCVSQELLPILDQVG